MDRTPQKIAPGRGITSKWAVLWPKWPCPKVPFPLRAKRARKAQNGTGTVPSRGGFANFSRRLLDFRMTSCPVSLSASCRPGSPRTSRITKCNFHDFRDFCFHSATGRHPTTTTRAFRRELFGGGRVAESAPLFIVCCSARRGTVMFFAFG